MEEGGDDGRGHRGGGGSGGRHGAETEPHWRWRCCSNEQKKDLSFKEDSGVKWTVEIEGNGRLDLEEKRITPALCLINGEELEITAVDFSDDLEKI